jgi:UPF0271 protein
MKLNCDLGESFGAWQMPVDADIMKFIDQANIACGFHAGDPVVMKQALYLAKNSNVEIGAHPSYPDLQGFGRRSLAMPIKELIACVQYQVSALMGMASIVGVPVSYVKPHGALYNDMMLDPQVRTAVMQAVGSINKGRLGLMVQSHAHNEALVLEAQEYGLTLIFEAFSDRRYTDEGFLQPRSQEGAVLTAAEALTQAKLLIEDGEVITVSGQRLPLQADTLCVHGDTAGAVEIAQQIRECMK